MSRKAIINMIERIVKNAGVRRAKQGARYETQLDHGFRKRFDTIMELNGTIKESLTEKMMGHTDGTRGRYVRPDNDKLFNEYKKAIPELTIDDSKRKQAELDKALKEKSELENQNIELINLKQGFSTDHLRINEIENLIMDLVQKHNKLSENKKTSVPEDHTLRTVV